MKRRCSQRVPRRGLLAVLLAGLILAVPAGAAPPQKKKPAKKPVRGEEDTLKKALDHLNKYAVLVQQLREAESRKKCADNLRQISLAVHKFPADAGTFPGGSPWMKGAMGDAFRHLLPYIEQDSLYQMAGPGAERLGARVEAVAEALASHLDLPKGRGMLIRAVAPKSAAARAGLQAHDILLELDGKPVPRDLAGFAKILQGIKAKNPVQAVVLRKGKKVTVKGITLPEAATSSPNTWYGGGGWSWPPNIKVYVSPADIQDGTSNTIFLAEKYKSAPRSLVSTTTFRREDRFTTRYEEGSLIITVTGKVGGGKVTVGQFKVQDGGVAHRYPSLDKVPAEYRDKASDLVQVSEKGQGKIVIYKK